MTIRKFSFCITAIIALLFSSFSFSQGVVKFTYDASGNRTSRTYVVYLPQLRSMQALPDTSGVTGSTGKLKVTGFGVANLARTQS
jgi:hypothetical protein